MINDKADWYAVFITHKENLRSIVKAYNNDELLLFDNYSNNKNENGEKLVSILNVAWFNAPDSSSIHYIPSWSALCNLCSESWVFNEDL